MYKTLSRLIKISAPYKYWMMLAAFIGFLTVGSGIGLLMTSAYLISKAALPISFAELQVGVVGVRFFGIFRGVFRYLERLISHEVTFKLLANFRVWFFSALEPMAPAKTIYKKSGDMLNRFVSDVEELQNIFLRVISPPMIAVVILLLMWFLLGIFNILFSVAFLCLYVTTAFVIPFIAFKASHKTGLEIVKVKTELQIKSVEYVQGMAELTIYDTNNLFIKEMNKLNSILTSLQQKLALINSFTEASIGFMMNITVISLLYFGIELVNNGQLEGVYLSVVVLGVMASFEALVPLPVAFQNLSKSVEAASRLFEIIDSNKPTGQESFEQQSVDNYEIQFNNVSFAYEDKRILDRVNFKIPRGKKIAIVGESGSGKSTIVNLLLGFWQPNEGEINLGGKNLLHLEKTFLRDHLAVMNQDLFLFNRTLKENLLLANENANKTQMESSIKKSNLSDKLNSLPNKYETYLGEQGLTFSGGERQRLCFARTLLKDSPIYIFDEPSSNLDAANEQIIFDTIFNINKEKTVILITHKLKHLKQADYIYFLDEGKIKEEGTFNSLMEKDGLFKSVFELQNQIIGVS